jgi:hypothetical protein
MIMLIYHIMAGLDHYNPSFVPLGYCFSYTREQELCMVCEYACTGDQSMYFPCECPNFTWTIIYTDVVVDRPITKAPSSTAYHFRIYKKTGMRANDFATIYHSLGSDDLTLSFTLDCAEDPRDLESLYRDYLPERITPYSNAWSTSIARTSYLSDLMARIGSIKASLPAREQAECAHVSPRSKIHTPSKRKRKTSKS